MFILIQFPFTDIRTFLNTETSKLKCPDLKRIQPYKHEFIRYFGPIKNRYNSLKFLSDEITYSRANRAIRIPNLEKYEFPNKKFILQSVFRRFYSNSSNCRVEIGFKNANIIKFTTSSFFKMLKKFLNLPVFIPSNIESTNNKNPNCSLLYSSTKLAPLYLHATTKCHKGKKVNIDKNWVLPGSPMVLIEYDKIEFPKLPPFIKFVSSIKDHGINLYHTDISLKGSNVTTRIWLIEKDISYGNIDKDYLRKLRLSLLRIHSEQESLKNVLTSIENDTIKIKEKDKLDNTQKYLNDTLKSISTKNKYGLPYGDIVALSNSYENIVNPTERKNILDRIKNIRPTLYYKIDTYTKPRKPTPILKNLSKKSQRIASLKAYINKFFKAVSSCISFIELIKKVITIL